MEMCHIGSQAKTGDISVSVQHTDITKTLSAIRHLCKVSYSHTACIQMHYVTKKHSEFLREVSGVQYIIGPDNKTSSF